MIPHLHAGFCFQDSSTGREQLGQKRKSSCSARPQVHSRSLSDSRFIGSMGGVPHMGQIFHLSSSAAEQFPQYFLTACAGPGKS